MIKDKADAAKAILFSAAITVFVLIIAALPSHCSTTKSHTNSLGTVQYQSNPMSYIAGAVVSASYVGSRDNYGVDVRVQPIGTYGLYTEELLLCGSDAVELFMNKTNPMVLIYETKSHHAIEGVGCHELKNALSLKTENIKDLR